MSRSYKSQYDKPKRSKASRLMGLFRFLITLAVILLLFGYIAFLYIVTTSKPAGIMPQADGIVVLTGGGNRLETAGALFASGNAERLLVSGTNSGVPDEDIRKLIGLSSEQFTCCVDIDDVAKDTIGNARETAIWAKALGYEHIILVTSDYHMPRAELELTSATGGMRITPYPVSTQMGSPLWKNAERLKILAKEYGKLLVIYASRMGDRPSHSPQPVPAPTDVMKQAQEPPQFTGPKAVLNPESDSRSQSSENGDARP